ncbi:hypothetical protein C8R44DRAFT_738659 [Mycena epipterygia]|nr:hypothetical protein C8R44DRAFT_738659 [Mycena epipterygia]
MSSLSEITISVLESVPPTSATTKVIIGVLILTMATFGTHYASPMHLLVAAISNVEKTYFEAIEAGVLTKSNVHTTETLSSVQIKVSSIREASLRNYLSTRQEFREFFKGRSFTILKCIREVRKLEADIENISVPLISRSELGQFHFDNDIPMPRVRSSTNANISYGYRNFHTSLAFASLYIVFILLLYFCANIVSCFIFQDGIVVSKAKEKTLSAEDQPLITEGFASASAPLTSTCVAVRDNDGLALAE